MKDLQEKIGYTFNDPKLLSEALTHSSHLGGINNERLEFLGDAVLELTVSEYLYNTVHVSEGEMTKLRASIVCSESLSKAAEQIMLGDYLRMGKGEIVTGGRHRKSILENAFEALVGAVFRDSDFETAKAVILRLLGENILLALRGELYKDYKTTLQEILQKDGNRQIAYELTKTEGPEHAKRFYITLKIDGKPVAEGIGKNKKEAEQEAAKKYFLALKNTLSVK